MITFGYKNKFNGPLRALTAIAIGVVMVLSKANALELAVRIIAAFLLALIVMESLFVFLLEPVTFDYFLSHDNSYLSLPILHKVHK